MAVGPARLHFPTPTLATGNSKLPTPTAGLQGGRGCDRLARAAAGRHGGRRHTGAVPCPAHCGAADGQAVVGPGMQVGGHCGRKGLQRCMGCRAVA